MEIAYINVFVSDLDRAVEFYEGKLGLKLEISSPEHGYVSFMLGNVRLGLAVPHPDQQNLIGRHTGVGLAVADLGAEHARLSKLGVRFPMPPSKQPWGGLMAILEDPDGNDYYLDQVSAVHS